MHLEGIGDFVQFDGYWELSPDCMEGSTLSIDAESISKEQADLSKHICKNWNQYILTCLRFIEEVRDRYGLTARNFSNLNVFVTDESEWTVFFDSDVEFEAVVGVEFKSRRPFQLIIGG